MTNYTVYIRNSSGTDDTFPFNRFSETDAFGEPWDGTIATQRDTLEESNLNFEAGQAEAAVIPAGASTPEDDYVFWGRLGDVTFDGTTAFLIVDSWERDADDTPLPDDDAVSNFDVVAGSTGVNGTGLELRYEDKRGDVIFSDMVEYAQTVTPGAVGATDDTYTVSFSNLSPAKVVRRQELSDEMYALYRRDKTVDYVSEPGRDRSDITLHPNSDRVRGDMTVTRDGFDDGHTHLLLLGAGGGGSDQISARVEVDATAETEKEKRLELKNVYQQSRLDSIARQLERELEESLVEVEVPIWRLGDVRLGDTFTVDRPSQGLRSRQLDVVEFERKFTGGADSYDVVLSSRKLFRKDFTQTLIKEIESYRTSKEPPVVHTTVSRTDPVGDGDPWTGDTDFWDMTVPIEPDTVNERRSTLEVVGTPYRARSGGAAGGGGAVADELSFPNGGKTVDAGTWVGLSNTQFSVPEDANDVISTLWLYLDDLGSPSSINVEARATDAFGSAYASKIADMAINNNVPGGVWITLSLKISDMPTGETLEWEVNVDGSGIASDVSSANTAQWYATGEHSHEPDPGLVLFDGTGGRGELLPENPQVWVLHPGESVNGDLNENDVAGDTERNIKVADSRWQTLEGDPVNPSGRWRAEVDLTGLLKTESGSDEAVFNRIVMSSGTLGEYECTFSGRYALRNTYLPEN